MHSVIKQCIAVCLQILFAQAELVATMAEENRPKRVGLTQLCPMSGTRYTAKRMDSVWHLVSIKQKFGMHLSYVELH